MNAKSGRKMVMENQEMVMGKYFQVRGNPSRDFLLTIFVSLQGRTGFPFIDAIMTQLRQEGWVHHLARHSVACFLTRGDLWCSWEEGMKVGRPATGPTSTILPYTFELVLYLSNFIRLINETPRKPLKSL